MLQVTYGTDPPPETVMQMMMLIQDHAWPPARMSLGVFSACDSFVDDAHGRTLDDKVEVFDEVVQCKIQTKVELR